MSDRDFIDHMARECIRLNADADGILWAAPRIAERIKEIRGAEEADAPCTCGHAFGWHACHLESPGRLDCATKDCGCAKFQPIKPQEAR